MSPQLEISPGPQLSSIQSGLLLAFGGETVWQVVLKTQVIGLDLFVLVEFDGFFVVAELLEVILVVQEVGLDFVFFSVMGRVVLALIVEEQLVVEGDLLVLVVVG